MAAIYTVDHSSEFDGLILFAASSSQNQSCSGLAVLSVYGSEYQLINAEKYESNRANLSADMAEVIIEGGRHAVIWFVGRR